MPPISNNFTLVKLLEIGGKSGKSSKELIIRVTMSVVMGLYVVCDSGERSIARANP